ncbi:MAG TPA: hypothetical protein VF746_13035 [Longimicrobium sp.]|jgi:hypothetical protein
MNRRQLLAAEVYGYSYANYWDHLEVRNERFTKLMPQDVDTLERADREGWDAARLAKALDTDEAEAEVARRAYGEAREIVDAPTPAESFRRGVRISVQRALEEGLDDPAKIEALVTQVCYRAADLAYLLDQQGETLSDYSEELRREPAVEDLDPE